MNCIICQDTGTEPVRENYNCNCKYKVHNSCWIDYVHSMEKVKCPICRSDIVPRKTKPTQKKETSEPLIIHVSEETRLVRTQTSEETKKKNLIATVALSILLGIILTILIVKFISD